MTAIRNLPDAPLTAAPQAPIQWRMPAFAVAAWHALQRVGSGVPHGNSKCWPTAVALGNPVLARKLREAAAECRREAKPAAIHTRAERSTS